MKNCALDQIAKWTQGHLYGEGVVQGVKVDSRTVEPGDLFICLRGAVVDGHNYVDNALERGAVAVMSEYRLDVSVPNIIVSDTMKGLRELGVAYRNTLKATVIAITGSNGKTSTKDILQSVLSLVGPTIATYKNQNTEIGTFLNIFRMDETTQFGVMECGLDYPGDVDIMAKILQPDYGLVMSLAPAHAANFKDVDAIADEKLMLLKRITNKDHCFYQGDFQHYRDRDLGWHTFGFNANNDFVVDTITSDNHGVSFHINGEPYKCNLLGKHQASNCAGALAVLRKIGVEDGVIRQGFVQVALTALRTEIIKKDASLVLMDAYKSNPISAKFALEILRDYEFQGERVAVLSEMVELGDDALALHQDMLETLKTMPLKYVYLHGSEYKNALKLGDYDISVFHYFESFETLKQAVQKLYQQPVMILIKGSRSYALERLMKED